MRSSRSLARSRATASSVAPPSNVSSPSASPSTLPSTSASTTLTPSSSAAASSTSAASSSSSSSLTASPAAPPLVDPSWVEQNPDAIAARALAATYNRPGRDLKSVPLLDEDGTPNVDLALMKYAPPHAAGSLAASIHETLQQNSVIPHDLLFDEDGVCKWCRGRETYDNVDRPIKANYVTVVSTTVDGQEKVDLRSCVVYHTISKCACRARPGYKVLRPSTWLKHKPYHYPTLQHLSKLGDCSEKKRAAAIVDADEIWVCSQCLGCSTNGQKKLVTRHLARGCGKLGGIAKSTSDLLRDRGLEDTPDNRKTVLSQVRYFINNQLRSLTTRSSSS